MKAQRNADRLGVKDGRFMICFSRAKVSNSPQDYTMNSNRSSADANTNATNCAKPQLTNVDEKGSTMP